MLNLPLLSFGRMPRAPVLRSSPTAEAGEARGGMVVAMRII
jgi:hypothetical protein